ncbi:recombinase family protein [Sporosarcina ureae]|uniref:recombinase family protein n=1 Tax=Sporosarcina ureae TaxID=1571 RepID=UPI000A17AD77|nr:recombinase family protein [Sporosarcina ureae]ARK21360.1 resolvase [Sporosarcina ureae]
MLVGYARVSTTGQSYETQKELLEAEGCTKIFVEKVTGTSTAQRKELKAMIQHVREGDTVIVTKIDRLARSILDLNKIVTELIENGVNVRFISESIEFKADGNANSLQTLLFNMLGSFAQFERDMIVERTTEGRERAKRQGKHLGRPSQPKSNVTHALELYDQRETNGLSVSDIVKTTGVPRSTIYNEIKKRS